MRGNDKESILEDVLLLEKVKAQVGRGEKPKLTLEQKRCLFVLHNCVTTVYFVAAPDAGVIKIGKTGDMDKRFSALSNGSPVPLRIICTVQYHDDLERRIHGHLRDYRSHGEWFYADKPVIEFARAARDKGIKWVVDTVGDEYYNWSATKRSMSEELKDGIFDEWLDADAKYMGLDNTRL